MATPKRIYLAGPEVFFPAEEHQAIVAEKKRLLLEYGLEGVDPLDSELASSDSETKFRLGHRIYRANRELMDSCYMIGQGKRAFGFTLDNRYYRERAGGTELDDLGHSIEDFEMSDNLMIEGGIYGSGGQLFVADQPGEHPFFSAELFRRCVQSLASA